MRNSFQIVLFALILLVSCKVRPRKVISKYPNGEVQAIIIYPDKSDTMSCSITTYYPNGKIYSEGRILKGRYVDKKVVYFENGKIKRMEKLTEPCDTNIIECNGVLTNYYENGNVSEQYIVSNNQFNGIAKQYDSSGWLSLEYVLKHDKKNGEYREFFETGAVEYRGTFRNDTAIGFSYIFNKSGDTARYYNNIRGQKTFPHKDFFENGTSVVGNFSDSTMNTVTWVWYSKNGKEIKRKIVKPNKEGGFVTPDH